jgi:hypothetical protein
LNFVSFGEIGGPDMDSENLHSALAVGLSLLTSPSRFKVVKGLVEKLTLKEISAKYGIGYRYVVRLATDLHRKGFLTRVKLFRNSIYIPNPQLVEGFKAACLELYSRASKLPESEKSSYLGRYGLTYEELLRLAGKEEVAVEGEELAWGT